MRVVKHAAGGSGRGRLVREDVDLGFGARAAAGSGFIGMIREDVDLGFQARGPRQP
jgi:hypothetical protein